MPLLSYYLHVQLIPASVLLGGYFVFSNSNVSKNKGRYW